MIQCYFAFTDSEHANYSVHRLLYIIAVMLFNKIGKAHQFKCNRKLRMTCNTNTNPENKMYAQNVNSILLLLFFLISPLFPKTQSAVTLPGRRCVISQTFGHFPEDRTCFQVESKSSGADPWWAPSANSNWGPYYLSCRKVYYRDLQRVEEGVGGGRAWVHPSLARVSIVH